MYVEDGKNNTTWKAQGFFNTDKILEYLSNINIMNFLCNQEHS